MWLYHLLPFLLLGQHVSMLDTMAEVRSHLGAPPGADDDDDDDGKPVVGGVGVWTL